MGELTRTQGRSPLRAEGVFPYGAWHRTGSLADIALAAAISASFITGLVGLGAASLDVADAGILTDGVDERLAFVSPAGFAWSDGIRAGDMVLAIRASDESGGWSMTVHGALGTLTTTSAPRDQVLRATVPIALLGLLISLIAFGLRAPWPRAAWAAAAVGIALSSTSIAVQGDALRSSVALGAALVLPATALLGPRLRSSWFLVAGGAILVFLGAWAVSRALAIGDPSRLEELRSTIAFWLTVGLVLSAALDARHVNLASVRRRPSSLDLAGVAGLAGLLIVLGAVFYVPTVVLLVVALVAFLAYPRSRRAILRFVDAVVLGGVRRQAAIEASEGERARLAADLHDVPIQELSAVIARLELVPDAVEERAALRRIASQLRALTTELRPPVLDDLGLPLAIEALADQYTRDGTAIRVEVDDRTAPEQVRAPDVELAIYRVTEEAVRNAVTHAAAKRIDVLGVIAADSMEIEVRDDGCGLDGHALERARKAGHAGLIAMRQRAEAIGARLSLRSEIGAGVSVIVTWRR